MADIIVDGKTRVFALTTKPADLTEITVAEITAGEVLHDVLVPTGLENFEASTAEVDASALSSSQDQKLPGRSSYSNTALVAKKQSTTDDVFDLLSEKETPLWIVILDGQDADSVPGTGDEYEVYPVRTGDTNYVGRGEANSVLRYRTATPINGVRVRGAIVAT